MIVLTLATDNNELVKEWKETADKWGYSYKILGMNKQWKGWDWRTQLYINELKKIDQNELVVIVDCYDLLFNGPPETIIKEYNNYNKPIIIGAANVCLQNCYKEHIYKCNQFNKELKYINAGCVVSTPKYLIPAYEFILKNGNGDDQYGWGLYKYYNCNLIQLDYQIKIVYNINNIIHKNKYNIKNGLLIKNNNIPPIIHIPNMYMDMGKRNEYIRSKLLSNYKGNKKIWYFKKYLLYIQREMKNYVYLKIWLPIIVIIITILIFIILK